MQKDPRAEYAKVTSEIKLKVTPDRAAVFVDDAYAGTAHEFGGVGRAMLVAPGKHHIKIDLPGYRTFDTDVNLLPRQKVTIKTKLEAREHHAGRSGAYALAKRAGFETRPYGQSPSPLSPARRGECGRFC